MCGISGLVLRDGEEVSAEILRGMASAMQMRGPDAEGIYHEKNIGLAHRRLKVIDLSSSANQPLFNENKRIAAVFNGEIYNFVELRKQLETLGHNFRSQTDTEVIVHAYEQWGEQSFARLNGMFAFGLWDGRGSKPVIYLVRDRFGIKPLFYALQGSQLAFASELKPILSVPWISKDIDRQILFYFLKFSHVPSPFSILSSVKQLEPGAWLRFEDGLIQQGKFFEATQLSGIADFNGTEDDAITKFEQIFCNVIRRQVVSDVPLGCFLSGGVDSTLITMAYSSLGKEPLKTFTIGYKEGEFNEASYAKQVSDIFKTKHYEYIASARDLFDIIPDIPAYFDQPFADPSLLPTLLLSKFARQEVTVALSGDGGDELFFGYPYQKALLYLKPLIKIPAPLRSNVFGLCEKLVQPFSHRLMKLAEILQFKNEAELLQYFIGTVGPMRLDRLENLLVEPQVRDRSVIDELLQDNQELSWEQKVLQVFINTFLTDTVLTKTDRTGMAFGLEARVPFLDEQVVEFASKLPFKMKYKNGKSKYLLRRVLEKKLPASISWRSKQGFGVPLREWLRGDLKYLLDEYLNEPRLKREGYFAPSKVRELVKAHLRGRANHSHLLWSLICFQMWKERYSI